MNKQAITFFSLFSLILVLSVYYVMIPPVNYENKENNTQEVSLKEQLDEKRANETQKQNEVLASSHSTGEQINQALETLSESKVSTSVEQKVTEALNKLGYNQVFCEINEKVIKVTISKNGANHEDALAVMECVLKTCQEKYSPEIKFIAE